MIIKHSQGSYPIRLLALDELLADLPSQAFVITDRNVAAAIGSSNLPGCPSLVLDPGEGNKTVEVYEKCLRWLAESRATRKSTIVALGGGVIGDLAGFVAATYMRGVSFIQIPTSLLAQVDSSVGGKVGIDLQEGKNLVGAFYPPIEVRLSLDILAKLPPRQFINGMAEVWKYGAIMDSPLFDELSRSIVTAEDPRLADIVQRCIELKAQVVEADEFETTGVRAILNFGHTVAHAVESLTGYGPVLHGEAVAIGMAVEAELGVRLGITPKEAEEALKEQLQKQGLPITHPVLRDTEAMVNTMRKDKKVTTGELAFSLITKIGGCKLIEGVNDGVVREILGKA